MRGFEPYHQVHVGPCQREQFAVRAHPGIDRKNRCIPQIVRSARQISRLFLEAHHAGAALRLGQFVYGGSMLQPTPFDGKVENPSQSA